MANWTLKIYMGLTWASTLCALVSVVWALDKHFYAKELHQQMAEVHAQATAEHEKMVALMARNRELNSRLAEYQRRDAVRLKAQQTGEAQLLETQDNGIKVMAQPHGGVRITSQ
ncbi:hypothetical protein [Ferrimonas balearica]|uniref:hypothetical protein n=1 Tax=Ferrimonas balearica TaxID=44012 RepID=UPI001C9A0928|nr:hypothetical protein [Ferrimonas balearica]MBY5990754.1 hypothetical protein [Ferrimonas balearica]